MAVILFLVLFETTLKWISEQMFQKQEREENHAPFYLFFHIRVDKFKNLKLGCIIYDLTNIFITSKYFNEVFVRHARQ